MFFFFFIVLLFKGLCVDKKIQEDIFKCKMSIALHGVLLFMHNDSVCSVNFLNINFKIIKVLSCFDEIKMT